MSRLQQYRQQQYRQQMGAAHVAIPGAVRVAGPPQGADGASRALATAIDGAVGMGMKLAAREHVLTEQTRMEERLLAARKEFGEWREQYQREHQGSDALDAGEAFQAKFAEIAGRHLEAFGGAGNEVFRRQLGGRLAAAGVLAREQGAAYASGQRQAWEKSVREGQIAQLEQDAFTAPDNTPWLDMQVEGVVRDEAARGRDTTALRRSLASHTQLTRIRGLVERGDLDGAARVLAGNVPGQEGSISASYESGAAGAAAIGHDRTGGTSYGTWQLSSRQGSLDGFLTFLASKGGDAAQAAARLRAAGPADTGSRKGAMPEAWKKEAARSPDFAAWQREFVQTAFFEPALRALPRGAAALASASPAVREMVWSTAVQHGAGGAKDIFGKTWREGMAEGDFIRAAYAERATRFGSSDPEVRAAVQKRLAGESALLASGHAGTTLTPEDAATAHRLLDRELAKREADARLRRDQARTAAAGFADAAAYGAAKGDWTAATRIVEEVETLDAGAGRTLRARLEARQTAVEAMQLHADKPLLEQREAAVRATDAHVTPEDARHALALQQEAAAAADGRIRQFMKDPAAFAAAARPELLDGDLPLRERTRRLLDAQSVLGRGLGVVPRVLGKAEAAEMERVFTESDPATRLRWLREMRAGYGEYFAEAATEANLPEPVAALAGALDVIPEREAAVLLSAVTAKEKDIPGVDADARAAAKDAVAMLPLMRELVAASRRFPGNEAARRMAASWETMLTNAALMGVDPLTAAKHFAVSMEADPRRGGGHLLLLPKASLPPDWDVDDLASAAEAAREPVLARLLEELPKGGTPLQRRLAERKTRGIVDQGVWISTAGGGGVALVEEVTGSPVTYADGSPVAFALEELLPIAKDNMRRRVRHLDTLRFGGR